MSSTRIPRKLDPAEIRVLGALLEKEQTTPELYPLTVNAVLLACNQKTNREPVMDLTEGQVVEALERLRLEVLVWRTEGARSEKWQQSVVRRWGLDRAGKALMTLLLLRGPQTPGELRTRSERMQPFASVEEVEEALQRMAAMDEPLVMELPRRPGQKEARWTHLVGDVIEEPVPRPPLRTARLPEPDLPAGPLPGALSARVAKLEEIVAKLAEDVETLKGLLM
ncbi:MAG: YceH family protein [Thermoanaerobaculia bacterium]